MSPPITREPPSLRVRLVLIWRLRMVGEPPKLVATPGRASLNCWEIWRSTSPFALHEGLDLELHPGLPVGDVLEDGGRSVDLAIVVRVLGDDGDLVPDVDARGLSALDEETGPGADHHPVILVEEVEGGAGLAGAV